MYGMADFLNLSVLHVVTLNFSLFLVWMSYMLGFSGNIDFVWLFFMHPLANLVQSSFRLSFRDFSPDSSSAEL